MLLPGHRWHLFLSHALSDAQHQNIALYDSLRDMLPGLKCFLDIKNNTVRTVERDRTECPPDSPLMSP